MPVTIELQGFSVSDPFTKYRWDIDFAAGGDTRMVFAGDRDDDQAVSLYTDFDATGSWKVLFDPPVIWGDVEGHNAAEYIADGTKVVGYIGTSNRLKMTDAAENVSGGAYADVIFGRGGDDLILGDSGRDWLSGGPGDDTLRGDREFLFADDFVFDAAIAEGGIDTILDFSKGDRLLLEASVFDALPSNQRLKSKFFDSGNKTADDKNDYLIYHKKKGDLYYDEDGSRKGHDPIKFAILDHAPRLSHKDFLIFDDRF